MVGRRAFAAAQDDMRGAQNNMFPHG